MARGRLTVWAFSGGGPFLAAPLRERPAWLRGVVAYYGSWICASPPGADSGLPTELREAFSAGDRSSFEVYRFSGNER